MYIGGTGRTLHQRLNDLRQSLRRADLMPWADPLPEAPALWAWWVEWFTRPHEEMRRRTDKLLRTGSQRSNQEKKPQVSSTGEWRRSLPRQYHRTFLRSLKTCRKEAGPVMLECSAAPLDASAAGRRGMESFLLYQYRQERGESPLCNFGRFHPRYPEVHDP